MLHKHNIKALMGQNKNVLLLSVINLFLYTIIYTIHIYKITHTYVIVLYSYIRILVLVISMLMVIPTIKALL